MSKATVSKPSTNYKLMMNYPEDFVNKIVEVFGENNEVTRLAKSGDYRLGSYLNDMTDEVISAEEIVKAIEGDTIDLHRLYVKARNADVYNQLWYQWNNILEEALDNKLITNNQIELAENC